MGVQPGSAGRVARLRSGLGSSHVDVDFVRNGLANGLAVVGVLFAIGLAALLIAKNNGGFAYDTESYTRAAHNILSRSELYPPPPVVSTYATYRYPPIFAQMFVPLTLLPDLAVHWLWRAVCVLSLRYLAGSWRATAICFILPPVFREVSLGNVTLPLGAACLFAVRDRRGAALLPWFASIKFGPVLLLPYLWIRHPESRRWVLAGLGVFAAVCAASFAAAPSLWFDYLGTFSWETATEMYSPVIIAITPAYGALDFAIRFGLASIAVVLAIRWRRDWLAFGAAAITCPYLDWGRLAPLVGLWRYVPARFAGGTPRHADPELEAGGFAPAVAAAPVAPPAGPAVGAPGT